MDDAIFLEQAKEIEKRHLQENLEALEKINSIDELTVLLFGESYSALAGYHACKRHVTNIPRVSKECIFIQDNYLKLIEGSD